MAEEKPASESTLQGLTEQLKEQNFKLTQIRKIGEAQVEAAADAARDAREAAREAARAADDEGPEVAVKIEMEDESGGMWKKLKLGSLITSLLGFVSTGISTAIGKEGAAGELELTPEVMEAFMGVSQLVPRTSIRKDRSGNVTVSATAVQTALIEALRGGDLSQQSQDLFKQLGGEATATGGVGFRRFFNNLFTNISSITQAAEDIYDENMDVFNKNTGPLKFVFDKKEEIINPATSFDGGYLNIKSTVSGKEVRNIFQAEENKLNMARRRMRAASTQKGPEATRAWLRAYAAAQLSYFKINLAYQYASYIQGGAAARTVSDADFLNNFRALFQQEGTGLIAVVNEISDQITQEEKLTRALLTKDKRNIGRIKHIEASFRSLSTARLRDSRRKRQQEILQSL